MSFIFASVLPRIVTIAYFRSVDYSAALKLEGVMAYISAKDIPGWKPDERHNRNVVGPVFRGESIAVRFFHLSTGMMFLNYSE